MNESSHVVGGSEPALIERPIGDLLVAAAERWPDVEALVSVEQDIRLCFAELARRTDRLAAGLLALGLRKGDRVGIWAPNCVEWTLTQFATARVGLILVNINPAYRPVELELAINKAGVRALIAAHSFKASNYIEMIESLAPEIPAAREGPLAPVRLPSLEYAIHIGSDHRPGWLRFSDIDAEPAAAMHAAAANIHAGEPINIQFTSGTTGSPKGATLSHRNIANNGFFVGLAMGMRAGDRLCIPVPLYHCFGMVMANLACVIYGATMIYPSAGFDPLAVLKTIQAERCTALYGVPTMFIAELGHPDFDRFDLSSLRRGIMAGSPCPIEVMRKTVSHMNMADVTIAYGMTETSPVSFQSGIDDPLERRVTTVGRIQPHLEAKVIDPEGRTLARGESGELCVRGYSVMLGYWNDPEQTAGAIDADGWMHSGDLGVIDEEGYCKIVGRAKDMIIRGGENVYPREIEEYLFRHPAIEDVAVVGVPDDKYGEQICAWVRLRDDEPLDEEAVRDFCRGQIAHYKVPHYVRFVESFPTTVSGKVQKFLIRQAMIDELGIVVEETA